MITRAGLVAVFWSLSFCTSTLAQTSPQLTPEETAAIKKAVKQCIAAVHSAAATNDPSNKTFFERFDAFFNPATGKVENNVTVRGDAQPFFVFKKCMAEKGFPLG